MKPIIRQIPSSAAYGLIELANPSGLRIQLLPDGGDVFAIRYGSTLISQVIPTPAERSMHRLVLRERGADGFQVVDLVDDRAVFHRESERQVCWEGLSLEWEYNVKSGHACARL